MRERERERGSITNKHLALLITERNKKTTKNLKTNNRAVCDKNQKPTQKSTGDSPNIGLARSFVY